jgi:transcriptional regulator with XRE-family HTH domain
MAKRGPASLVEELRQAVQGSGLSLNEIERRCGVSHAVLSRFLRGERTLTLPLAAKLCEALGLHLCRHEETLPAATEAPPAPKHLRGRPRHGRAG